MEKNKNLLIPAAIFGAGVLIAISIFATGGLNIPPRGGLPAQVGGQLPSENNALPSVAPPVTADDHIRGNQTAPVTIIEYSDFQCPFCRQFHPTMRQALAEYGDQVRWVYKHFPLDQLHPQARPAAEASECVAEQKGSEGFWQFADALFENQERLGSALYREAAEQSGFDMTQFDACVSERKYQDKVEAQMQEGIRFGVTGTPGNFVNDTLVPGALPYANLKTIIDAELEKL
ncbi:MAG TPA: disulfide bond formation protein DsbA [Candidatus Wildermuthbacteria bacterium]|uniref:Sodium/proton antiporter n=1 Tax=Candidatus Yanofskybacteria bacterium GW2011_GWC1_48_11 TaxID=1619027 RepID=A0A837INL0_9BACT|nr:MAG: Sodium/proton antiporter [Candidatus Yanofskybacteria bacterium GW2011_GWC1_48_11]KKW04526.1 MAG: Sodium/proton antiporter [Parcubacteria group bacterium GW2011_GWB1_49_12]KKW09216.1 MAG: Sodium/proton antiporter [Parcubacteria group bacterium GW2011_GWA1_49_26]KKW14146.1 MAG: Sodium/proton antiporter [Parcubacteria group bacterium GW2011_GWA2_50_10]HCM36794.1 disulfide bond formation protein DsbA [Candidatus Wildermuthbacteria bacterium]